MTGARCGTSTTRACWRWWPRRGASTHRARSAPPSSTIVRFTKEALAIVFAMDKFHQNFYGIEFILRTDHKLLVTIFGPHTIIPSTPASRLQRWAITLSAYDFNIEYIRTEQNIADVLSRLISTFNERVSKQELDTPEKTYLHFASEAFNLKTP